MPDYVAWTELAEEEAAPASDVSAVGLSGPNNARVEAEYLLRPSGLLPNYLHADANGRLATAAGDLHGSGTLPAPGFPYWDGDAFVKTVDAEGPIMPVDLREPDFMDDGFSWDSLTKTLTFDASSATVSVPVMRWDITDYLAGAYYWWDIEVLVIEGGAPLVEWFLGSNAFFTTSDSVNGQELRIQSGVDNAYLELRVPDTVDTVNLEVRLDAFDFLTNDVMTPYFMQEGWLKIGNTYYYDNADAIETYPEIRFIGEIDVNWFIRFNVLGGSGSDARSRWKLCSTSSDIIRDDTPGEVAQTVLADNDNDYLAVTPFDSGVADTIDTYSFELLEYYEV